MQKTIAPIPAIALVASIGLCALRAQDAPLSASGASSPAPSSSASNTLSPVTVTGTPSTLSEEDAVGPYNQPEWTEHRRFSTTRVYLQQDPGDVGFEQWWRNRTYDHGSPEQRFQEELEIGLPWRFQLDFYDTWAFTNNYSHFDETSIEIRYALADWGKIPGNPTLYAEYAFANHRFNGNTLEWKVLLGDDLFKRWHWGLNFAYEGEIGYSRAETFTTAFGLSYTLIDKVLGAGVEMQWSQETDAGKRNYPIIEFEIGPSIQWRPTRSTHLDLVALFGTTGQGPKVESYVIFGWDFGGPHGEEHYRPTAGFQR